MRNSYLINHISILKDTSEAALRAVEQGQKIIGRQDQQGSQDEYELKAIISQRQIDRLQQLIDDEIVIEQAGLITARVVRLTIGTGLVFKPVEYVPNFELYIDQL